MSYIMTQKEWNHLLGHGRSASFGQRNAVSGARLAPFPAPPAPRAVPSPALLQKLQVRDSAGSWPAFQGGGVSGADQSELQAMNGAVLQLARELDRDQPTMFKSVSGVGWSWPWEDDEPVTVLKPGIATGVPSVPGVSEKNPGWEVWRAVRDQYSAFYAEWAGWLNAHGGTFSSFGAEAEQQFEIYKLRFNDLRRKAIAVGVKTVTSEQLPKGEGAGGWSLPWWGWVAGGALVLLAIGPFVIAPLAGVAYAAKGGSVKGLLGAGV
jgi:hypothetical protein